ncbi:MAG: heme-copper oxidase subunit III [Thermoleophilia bacterium]
MSTAESTAGHAPAASGASPQESRGSQINMVILSMYFFIGSEIMLFGSLFAAYFFVRFNVADQWPPLNQDGEPFELPKIITGVNTAVLVASSFTVHWAEHRFKHYGDRKGLQRGLLVTMMLGLTFLIIQINEYVHLGFTPADKAFGSTFYTLTGFHGLHVFVGFTLLTLCYIRITRAKDFTPNSSAPLGAASLYWHFVDVVWILLYILVYLI